MQMREAMAQDPYGEVVHTVRVVQYPIQPWTVREAQVRPADITDEGYDAAWTVEGVDGSGAIQEDQWCESLEDVAATLLKEYDIAADSDGWRPLHVTVAQSDTPRRGEWMRMGNRRLWHMVALSTHSHCGLPVSHAYERFEGTLKPGDTICRRCAAIHRKGEQDARREKPEFPIYYDAQGREHAEF